MRVAILAASELGAEQLAAIAARIAAPEHAHDRRGCLFWHREGAAPKLFAALLAESGTPIGIVHVDGPLNHVHPAWWLDSRYRGRGLGSRMIDALAVRLAAGGYTGAGRIAIDSFGGQYDAASSALARRLEAQLAGAGQRAGC
jgi:ribosomal protein S18 acetylase RimI-like enzyme